MSGIGRSLLLASLACTSLVAASNPQPLSIPPSLHWDGDNGQWSTFDVEVGQPSQHLRLLPGTSSEASTVFWVIDPIGCDIVNPTLQSCPEGRGGTFATNKSTSWSTQELENHADGAIYTLPTVEEGKLGLALNGSFGYDTISLGLGVSGLPTLTNSLIASIWTDDYYIGFLPLSPYPFNFSFATPTTSMLGQLKNESQISSLSWAYTAGAYYQDSTTNHFGSLTLGGYDASRFTKNDVTFSFGSDYTRDLLVKLSSITYNTVSSSPLLTSSINVFIDSLVSELWLPTSVCEAFAQAFNLTYNTQGNYYLVNPAVHTSLLAQNPKFNFTLMNSDKETVSIALPYAAFDLNLTMPIVGNTTNYFPIRRAQNESQYVLGRTFLQEAYIIADFERRNFSLSQALFPPTSVQQQIVAINIPGADSHSSSRNLNGGAIAGIVIGVLFFLALLTVIVFVCWRKRRQQQAVRQHNALLAQQHNYEQPPMTELDAHHRAELHGGKHHNAHEIDGIGDKGVLVKSHEIQSTSRYELHGAAEIHELQVNNTPVELDASK